MLWLDSGWHSFRVHMSRFVWLPVHLPVEALLRSGDVQRMAQCLLATSTFKEVQPRVTRSGVSTTQQRSLCRCVCASSFVHEHLSAGEELCAS